MDVFGSAFRGAPSSQFSVEYHLIVKVCDQQLLLCDLMLPAVASVTLSLLLSLSLCILKSHPQNEDARKFLQPSHTFDKEVGMYGQARFNGALLSEF